MKVKYGRVIAFEKQTNKQTNKQITTRDDVTFFSKTIFRESHMNKLTMSLINFIYQEAYPLQV